MPKEITGGPIEIRSERNVYSFVVRHLNDDEYLLNPAIALEGPTGTLYVKPGQLNPLISALVELFEEVL